jgi:alkyl hydroperoxide reductase subunit AhpC
MSIQLGDVAPDFTANSTEGEIRLHEWIGDSWAVLFSHPKDFTPVCTTELGAVARLKPEFDRRGVKVIGLSVDGVADHEGWSRDIEATQGVPLNFPLVADPDRAVSTAYGMIHPNADTTATVRSVFVIDDKKVVRLTLTYPASTGRNFDEILRAIDSLRLTSSSSVATPANWQPGQDVIILASLNDEQAAAKFPDGWRAERPYLRYVPDPSTSSGAPS